jgi:cell division protein ZapD
MIIYEQPINEITRILLKLEYLLQMGEHHAKRTTPWDSHTTLIALCDILNLLDRPDLRSKLTKEIQRYVSTFLKLQLSPGVNHVKLKPLLDRLNAVLDHILTGNGRLAQSLRDDEFLGSIRQHLMSPAGTCNFDIPLYHHWNTLSATERTTAIQHWFVQLADIKTLVTLLLELIRDSSELRPQIAHGGFYQMTIDPFVPTQLIRVALYKNTNVFPEISAGKHRLSIYFYNVDFHRRPIQTHNDIEFELSICIL